MMLVMTWPSIFLDCPECDTLDQKVNDAYFEMIDSENSYYIAKHEAERALEDLLNAFHTDPPDGGRLRFDFAVFENNVLSHLIEYDGRQHFEPVKYMGGEKRFKIQVRNDKLKDEYCSENNIRLIRLPYTEYRNIDLEMLK